mmetsp:Transcript_18604/g.46609  ORF Transcript_18604/g.46609 Transcript_18604/m.46609 type:complete len:338 (+) Transcript_18604:1288-2301(+)
MPSKRSASARRFTSSSERRKTSEREASRASSARSRLPSERCQPRITTQRGGTSWREKGEWRPSKALSWPWKSEALTWCTIADVLPARLEERLSRRVVGVGFGFAPAGGGLSGLRRRRPRGVTTGAPSASARLALSLAITMSSSSAAMRVDAVGARTRPWLPPRLRRKPTTTIAARRRCSSSKVVGAYARAEMVCSWSPSRSIRSVAISPTSGSSAKRASASEAMACTSTGSTRRCSGTRGLMPPMRVTARVFWRSESSATIVVAEVRACALGSELIVKRREISLMSPSIGDGSCSSLPITKTVHADWIETRISALRSMGEACQKSMRTFGQRARHRG